MSLVGGGLTCLGVIPAADGEENFQSAMQLLEKIQLFEAKANSRVRFVDSQTQEAETYQPYRLFPASLEESPGTVDRNISSVLDLHRNKIWRYTDISSADQRKDRSGSPSPWSRY